MRIERAFNLDVATEVHAGEAMRASPGIPAAVRGHRNRLMETGAPRPVRT